MRWTSGVGGIRVVRELACQGRFRATGYRRCAADSDASRDVSLAPPLAPRGKYSRRVRVRQALQVAASAVVLVLIAITYAYFTG